MQSEERHNQTEGFVPNLPVKYRNIQPSNVQWEKEKNTYKNSKFKDKIFFIIASWHRLYMCEWKSLAKKNKEMLRFTIPTRVSGSLVQRKIRKF